MTISKKRFKSVGVQRYRDCYWVLHFNGSVCRTFKKIKILYKCCRGKQKTNIVIGKWSFIVLGGWSVSLFIEFKIVFSLTYCDATSLGVANLTDENKITSSTDKQPIEMQISTSILLGNFKVEYILRLEGAVARFLPELVVKKHFRFEVNHQVLSMRLKWFKMCRIEHFALHIFAH